MKKYKVTIPYTGKLKTIVEALIQSSRNPGSKRSRHRCRLYPLLHRSGLQRRYSARSCGDSTFIPRAGFYYSIAVNKYNGGRKDLYIHSIDKIVHEINHGDSWYKVDFSWSFLDENEILKGTAEGRRPFGAGPESIVYLEGIPQKYFYPLTRTDALAERNIEKIPNFVRHYGNFDSTSKLPDIIPMGEGLYNIAIIDADGIEHQLQNVKAIDRCHPEWALNGEDFITDIGIELSEDDAKAIGIYGTRMFGEITMHNIYGTKNEAYLYNIGVKVFNDKEFTVKYIKPADDSTKEATIRELNTDIGEFVRLKNLMMFLTYPARKQKKVST